MAARKAHNLEVGGSSPPPAPNEKDSRKTVFFIGYRQGRGLDPLGTALRKRSGGPFLGSSREAGTEIRRIWVAERTVCKA